MFVVVDGMCCFIFVVVCFGVFVAELRHKVLSILRDSRGYGQERRHSRGRTCKPLLSSQRSQP